jgi:hypothetical protein
LRRRKGESEVTAMPDDMGVFLPLAVAVSITFATRAIHALAFYRLSTQAISRFASLCWHGSNSGYHHR